MPGCQNSRNETKKYTYRCSVVSNFKCNLTSQNCITGGHIKCKIENNKTSYPLISASNSILVNFTNLATDIGSFIDAGRLFHNTDPLNFNKRLPKEEFTDSRRRCSEAHWYKQCKKYRGRLTMSRPPSAREKKRARARLEEAYNYSRRSLRRLCFIDQWRAGAGRSYREPP